MIHLAPLLAGGPVGVVGGRRTLIAGLGLALGLGGIGLVPGGPLHGCGCRHCLVDAVPIGSRGYATGVEFAAHLSRADGSSQVLATIRWPFRRSGCCSGWLPGAAAAAVSTRTRTKAPAVLSLLPLRALPLSLLSRLLVLVTLGGGCGRLGLPRTRSRRLRCAIGVGWV